MGYENYLIDGALYGFKTELLEMLRNGDVPKWVSFMRGLQGSDSSSPRSYFQTKSNDSFYYGGKIRFQLDTETVSGKNEVSSRHTPERIVTKCDEWLEENRDHIEYHDGADFIEFRCFVFEIHLGERGGINDVSVSARFKNH